MGTAEFQGKIWGSRASDWVECGEPISMDLFNAVLNELKFNGKTNLLDIGCGGGTFCGLASARGARVTGIDASENLIAIAKRKVAEGIFHRGDMENLPYRAGSFDFITGFNSFQFAGSIVDALREAYRVAKEGASVSIVFWGSPEQCDATAVFTVLGEFLPPPPEPKPDRKPLYTPGVFEEFAAQAGFRISKSEDVVCEWNFENEQAALRCMLSAGMTSLAIERSGEQAVREAISKAIQQFKTPDGLYRFKNKFRFVKLIK